MGGGERVSEGERESEGGCRRVWEGWVRRGVGLEGCGVWVRGGGRWIDMVCECG